MVLPLYLAMTASEMRAADAVPEKCAWMACQFSPYGQGLTNIPAQLPPGSILILNDRMPCRGHSPDLAADQLAQAVEQLGCESVLLDFQQPPDPESEAMAAHIVSALPCPAAVSEKYAKDLSCPVFVSPAPLHIPLSVYLAPWRGREIWLEAALGQEAVTVTTQGTAYTPQFPTDGLEGGFFEDTLCCHYRTQILEDAVRFTLFDTPDSLQKKLALSPPLGVTRAVGLWQELGHA